MRKEIVAARLEIVSKLGEKIAFSVISVKVGYTGVKCLMMIVKVWIHLLSIQPTQETVFKLPHVTWLLQL